MGDQPTRCEVCTARYQKKLEAVGWRSVLEILQGVDDYPLMTILRHIAEAVADQASAELEFYATRPAYYNTRTRDLVECGGWEDLWCHEYGDQEA